jgi:hypothetical protein
MKRTLVFALAMALLLTGQASAQGTTKLPRIGLLSAGADPMDPILFVPFFAYGRTRLSRRPHGRL